MKNGRKTESCCSMNHPAAMPISTCVIVETAARRGIAHFGTCAG